MILTCFRYIFLIMALASNLVVCLAMVKTKDHRKTLSKFFIFQLAVVDVAFRILECYELISERLTDGALGLTHCRITVFVQYICAAVIFSLLAGIALDRSKNIIYPLRSFKNRSYNRRKRALFLIWLYAIAVSAGFFLTSTSVRFSHLFGAAGNRNSSISRVNMNASGGELLFQSPKSFCTAGPPNSLQNHSCRISFVDFSFLSASWQSAILGCFTSWKAEERNQFWTSQWSSLSGKPWLYLCCWYLTSLWAGVL